MTNDVLCRPRLPLEGKGRGVRGEGVGRGREGGRGTGGERGMWEERV